MKYIPIPETIPLYNLTGERMKESDDTDAEVTFSNFVLGRLGDPRFSVDRRSVQMADEIIKKMEGANGMLELPHEHWKLLSEVTDKPSQQSVYHPAVSRNLLPFMNAICEAKDEPPTQAESESE